AQVQLTQGNRYYIETLHKQNVGLDCLAATYVLPPDALIDTPGLETLPMDASVQGSVQLTPIIEALRIVTQPVGRFVNVGQTAKLTFELSGSAPRQYQWFLDTGAGATPLVDGNTVSGATTAILTLTPFTAA